MSLAERSSLCGGRIVQSFIPDVTVDVDGRRDGRVSEDATDDVHRGATVEHDRAGRVA